MMTPPPKRKIGKYVFAAFGVFVVLFACWIVPGIIAVQSSMGPVPLRGSFNGGSFMLSRPHTWVIFHGDAYALFPVGPYTVWWTDTSFIGVESSG